MELDEEFITKTAIEIYIAKMVAMYAGALTGKQVVSAHKCVREKMCKDKTGWDLFECIVDHFHELYDKIKKEGYEKAMEKYSCKDYIVK
jgi:hypothetical protein